MHGTSGHSDFNAFGSSLQSVHSSDTGARSSGVSSLLFMAVGSVWPTSSSTGADFHSQCSIGHQAHPPLLLPKRLCRTLQGDHLYLVPIRSPHFGELHEVLPASALCPFFCSLWELRQVLKKALLHRPCPWPLTSVQLRVEAHYLLVNSCPWFCSHSMYESVCFCLLICPKGHSFWIFFIFQGLNMPLISCGFPMLEFHYITYIFAI